MLRNPSLLVQPVSGFVPFSGGGNSGYVDIEAVATAPVRALAPAVVTARPDRDTRGVRRAAWQPAGSSAVRRVETAVLASVCGYFVFGFCKVLGLF